MKKIFINNLLITLIFFFIFEIFLRSFGLADLRGHGKELKEKRTNVETTVFGKKVFLDQYGYRVPYKEFVYKKNENKIIFIGDSVLFGSGVNEEETFVGRLRKDKDNEDKSYVNAAIIGNDVSENLSDIKKNYKLFGNNNFFIILTLDDIINNKVTENKNEENEKNANLIQRLKNNYFLRKINLFLRTKSYTYLWLKGIVTKPSKRYFFESFDHYKDEEKINFFNTKIGEIKNFEKFKGINIKFIILPYEYQTRNYCESKFLLPQEKILKVFEEREIDYINLTKNFCDHPNPKKLYLNFDPVHLSIKGHDFVSKLIKNGIH